MLVAEPDPFFARVPCLQLALTVDVRPPRIGLWHSFFYSVEFRPFFPLLFFVWLFFSLPLVRTSFSSKRAYEPSCRPSFFLTCRLSAWERLEAGPLTADR